MQSDSQLSDDTDFFSIATIFKPSFTILGTHFFMF